MLSDTSTGSFVVAPIADFPAGPVSESAAKEKKCARAECTTRFLVGTGYVPGIDRLYRTLRNPGVVRKSQPLTEVEVLSQELCHKCRRLAAFKTFDASRTIQMMARWAAENEVFAAERELNRLTFVDRRNERSLTVQNIAEAAERHRRREEAGRKKYRTHKHVAKLPKDPNAPKKYGDEKRLVAATPKAAKKAKGGKQKGGNGKK